MPTRSQFLATGLVPIVSSNLTIDDVCSICTCDFSEPARTPCGHVFDVECVTRWLNMRGRNTCPMCKSKLFDLPEDEDRGAANDRQTQVVAAIRTSHLNERDSLSIIEAYQCDVANVRLPSLQRATAHASRYLTDEVSRAVSGPSVLRADKISASFLAMGNLIPALARAQGRAYDQQQSMAWKLVLTTLWQALQSQNGKRFDAMVMPAKLRQDLKMRLRSHFSDTDSTQLFSAYFDGEIASNSFSDLDFLLKYLTLCCWTLHREEEAFAAKKAETEAAKQQFRNGTKSKRTCSVM